MKAKVPAAICLAVFIYACWTIQRSRNSYFPLGSSYKVEVTVTGPDGKVIPAVGRAPQ